MPDGIDLLVVGGGSCGCVVAARASEDPNRRVTLVEAGPVFGERRSWPAELLDGATMPLAPTSPWVARYPTELTEGRRFDLVRGRVLGGSGAVNGGYFVRAQPTDFDAFGSALWDYATVLPFFRRSETDLDFTDEYHGATGPIPVRRAAPGELTPISAEAARAAVDIGFPEIPDLNAPTAGDGVGAVPCNVVDGIRVNTALGYLAPVIGRPNLDVRGRTRAQRILFEGSTAVGVEIVGPAGREVLSARQVVVCSGAIESATLLLRSGVGDPDSLRHNDIAVVHELPGVGAEFFDHPEIALPYELADVPSGGEGAAPLQITIRYDDIEIRPYARPLGAMIPGGARQQSCVGVTLMKPKACGRLRPSADGPALEHRYLTERADRDRLRSGVEFAAELLDRLAARGIVRRTTVEASDSWLDAHLGSSQHLTGTCRMGADAGAVVDERCRVRGLQGLSVIDASILPVSLSAGPHATAVMLAERACEFLGPIPAEGSG